MQRYNPIDIEPKWQEFWDKNGTYVADLESTKNKYYAMSMFNYPSGAGIHIGHAMNYTISDVMARFKRQQGYESYHPVGWDAFGLPAENYAIKTGVSPQESMAKIIPGYHKQYKAMGWSNDWTKEIATHEPEYYKWTQWIFAQMFKAGLAYQDARMQWWCDIDKTVLSNEQVVDGKCWRHDGPDDPLVTQREIKQWFFKITDYAEEMLDATDALDWTESVKLAQKNWIGKSQGAEIDFAIDGRDEKVRVFTTRPDTIFGATFIVLAPEHPMISTLITDEQKQAAEEYVSIASKKSELERMETKEKTGVFSGSFAVNPVSGEKIPIWIADYVLFGYGTGAIMAVPAHDERDFEFAVKYELSIRQVVAWSWVPDDISAPRDGVETIHKETIDAIIHDGNGNYLLQVEQEGHVEHIHFVGGGVDPEDENPEATVRREVLEETGLSDITSLERVSPLMSARGYRHTKNKNQHGVGAFYEVQVGSTEQAPSEIETGKHSVRWVRKEEVANLITWDHHRWGWSEYLSDNVDFHGGEGIMVNSGQFDRLSSSDAREKIVEWLESEGFGESKTTFKIRDWSVSRQRYWGAPIPIIHCQKDGAVLVPDDQLPVVLPALDDFTPTGDGRGALARATDWMNVECPKCGGPGERETDTLDTYICSSWYFLRYLDPHNSDAAFATPIANKWMPVDFYNGGDHATAHMIYARFVTRFLHHQGLLGDPEPFKRFLFNGKVTASDGSAFSKSKGNGIDPLEIISSGYGADALRTYLMFAAPLEFSARWDSQGVPGTFRFLNRIWNLVQEFGDADDGQASDAVLRIVHPAIKKVTADLEDQKYNTSIAAMMKLTNDLYELKAKDMYADRANWLFALESLVALVAPFAPHISEELWHLLGNESSVHRDSWPKWDDKYLVSDTLTIVVQVNGKLRATVELAANTPEEDIKKSALDAENVAKYLDGKEPLKVIYIPKKLVNIVVK
jgi:leucyl-tRNA synthetase